MNRARWAPLVSAVLLAGVLVGCSAPSGSNLAASGPAGSGSAEGALPSPPPVHPRGFHAVRDLPSVAAPQRLRIPSIGVDTPLDRLPRKPDGTIQVPTQWQVAGWYEDGPKPGEPGPAAILGHVDSTSGPAVFARLRDLPVGSDVLVDTGGGTGSSAGAATLRFRVTGMAEFPKDQFPTQEVYLPTLEPVLRLITCGGAFDPATGHYRDNVVVSAAQVS